MDLRGQINYGNFNVLPSHDPRAAGTGNLLISGDVDIRGRLHVHGDVKLHTLERENTALRNEIGQLHDQVRALEQFVNAMWYSPGMPGFVLAEAGFDEKVALSNAPNSSP